MMFGKTPSWHKRLSTMVVTVPSSTQRQSENNNNNIEGSDQVELLVMEKDAVDQSSISDQYKDPAINEGKWGDGTSWNVVYKTINPDGKEIKEDYLMDGFTKPINFCEAYRFALIKLHNLHPENKFFDIKEISKMEVTENQ